MKSKVTEASVRASLKEKKRIIVKVGSSSLVHSHTGALNLTKAEKLVRILTDLRNEGKEVCLVSSGAIAVGAGNNRDQYLTEPIVSPLIKYF